MKKIKLGDILEIQPKSKVKAGEGITNGKYPFYTCSNELTKSVNTADYEGDALIMGTGGMASIHYEKGKFSTSTDCLVYKSNKNVNLSLINKYLRTNIYLLENGFKGAGLRHISRDYISNITIPLPERNLQDKIVKELDLIEKTITNHNDVLKKYDTLIKSRFIEMFGDIRNQEKYKGIPLSNLCKTMTGGTPPTSKPEYYEGTIPWITTVSLGPNHIDGKNAKGYITEESIKNSATKLIPVGNILFGTRVGVGKSSINDVDICTNQDIIALIGIDESRYSKLFIKHVLDQYQPYFDSIKKGATILGITTDDVKKSLIPDVSLSLQKEFENFVQQIDKSKFEYNIEEIAA